MNREEKVFEFIKETKDMPLKFEELAVMLCVPKEEYSELEKILNSLLCDRKIKLTKNKRYKFLNDSSVYEGEFIGNNKGFGFVISDNFDEDIFIAPEDTMTAMNGDKVLFSITREKADGKRRQGKIKKVIERSNMTVVGTYMKSRNFGFVKSDDKKIAKDIFISKNNTMKAKDGQKVVCKLLNYGNYEKNPEGKIIEIIGFADEGDNDIIAVIKQYGLSEKFPKAVSREAEEIPKEISSSDLDERLDLREKTIVTIDGDDAKDLDDAISLEKDEKGNYRLGVHIADVSHYVKEGSELDKEAYNRGTSVYLVDRVLPMLPRRLSNGICSLNPYEDRLTLSVFMTIDEKGNIIDREFAKSVILSKARLTYSRVSEFIKNPYGEIPEEYIPLKSMLFEMKDLALILRNKRKKRGSLDFDFPECSICLDEYNNPIEIKKYELDIANYIIEEFMLAANETVAEYVFWQNKPFIYRIHEEPDEEKMNKFLILAKNLGYRVKGKNGIHQQDLIKLQKECSGTKEERFIETMMLRSLMKAKYSPDNKGHFGLAAEYYCHFTSPIRRYPDLVIHRILKMIIENRFFGDTEEKYVDFVEKAANHSSKCEQNAEMAERDTNDMKKAEYMTYHIGEEYEGIISSVTSFGIFVELENTVEGIIRYKDIDEFFDFDEENYTASGRESGRIFRIGDTLNVRVFDAIPELKEVVFEIV